MDLTDLRDGFRDDAQLWRVRAIVHERLADDRDQQECRYVMRFWWQLSMPYREVSTAELSRNVAPRKLRAIEELIDAVRSSPARIDAWIAGAEQAFPIVEDRGFRRAREAECEGRAGLVGDES